MWQLEAVQTVGDGTGSVIDAATIAEEQRFMDFTMPDLSADKGVSKLTRNIKYRFSRSYEARGSEELIQFISKRQNESEV